MGGSLVQWRLHDPEDFLFGAPLEILSRSDAPSRSRRAKSPAVTKGGGARRGSEARREGSGSRSRPHPAEPRAGAPGGRRSLPPRVATEPRSLEPRHEVRTDA